jgi:hypothetical protein
VRASQYSVDEQCLAAHEAAATEGTGPWIGTDGQDSRPGILGETAQERGRLLLQNARTQIEYPIRERGSRRHSGRHVPGNLGIPETYPDDLRPRSDSAGCEKNSVR